MTRPPFPCAIVVLDIGKTNVKLTAAEPDGRLLETLSTPNPVYPGPPYVHHDLARLEDWIVEGLAMLGTRHDVEAIVTSGHGSGGVLVGADGPAMPMIDYEQSPPADLDDAYRGIAGSFRERGSPIMLGTAHMARQMLWLERDWPDSFARASHFLATPQYWSWRLSGVAASEVTILAAQSHLWAAADARPARLVAARGWARLMPKLTPAWATLGPLRADLVARTGLSRDVRVLCGIHDSSANLYRYQAAGLADMTVVSTGTWVAAISDRPGPDIDVEQPGLCCNADVSGAPLSGMLTMGGREFTAVAGTAPGPASREQLARLAQSGTLALPSFGSDDGLFPGTTKRGRLVGPLRDDPAARFTLAVLYAALLTDRCLRGLDGVGTIVLDGSFVRDPLYGSIVAALNPGKRVLVNLDSYGVATGAALLASHETRDAPAPLSVDRPDTSGLPDLAALRARWLNMAHIKENPNDQH